MNSEGFLFPCFFDSQTSVLLRIGPMSAVFTLTFRGGVYPIRTP